MTLAVLDALAPNAATSLFPFPKLVTSTGPGGSFVSEGPILAGTTLPGQWLLTDCTRVFGWEEIKGPYLSGATLRPVGDPLLLAKYAIKIWNSADAGVYLKLLRGILKKPVIQLSGTGILSTNASTAALGIEDPQLNALGVDTVVVWSVSTLLNPLVSSGGKGAWTAAVEFKEYRAPIPAVATPDQRVPSASPPAPSAADNIDTSIAQQGQGAIDRQRELARLLQVRR